MSLWGASFKENVGNKAEHVKRGSGGAFINCYLLPT